MPGSQGAASEEEDVDLDDFEKEYGESKENKSSIAQTSQMVQRFNCNLMVDLSYEQFIGPEGSVQSSFSSNHNYVILSYSPAPSFTFSMELIQQVYYEASWYILPEITLKFGKIPIPFSSQFLHQLYGGVVEKPGIGGSGNALLVPRDWAEYGLCIENKWIDAVVYSLQTKLWITNGLEGNVDETQLGNGTVSFDTPSWDNNLDKAVGLRLVNNFWGRRISVNGSIYTSKWANDLKKDANFLSGDRIFIYGIDASLNYNLIPVRFFQNFMVKGAYADVHTSSSQIIEERDLRLPAYDQTGTFIECNYNGLQKICDIQFRYGTYDDNTAITNSRDLVNYNVALIFRPNEFIEITPRYMWNRENVNEKRDDYFMIKAVIKL